MGAHIVLAPDKFKGSLTAQQAARAMAQGVRRADPTATTIACPVADGGEGTLDAVVAAGFEQMRLYGIGPTGATVGTAYARMGKRAVIEMADICGLQRLPGATLAPMTATSYGLGSVIARALDDGCRDIVITIGGSASTDGGAGMLIALGASVVDHHGRRIAYGGGALIDAARLDLDAHVFQRGRSGGGIGVRDVLEGEYRCRARERASRAHSSMPRRSQKGRSTAAASAAPAAPVISSGAVNSNGSVTLT